MGGTEERCPARAPATHLRIERLANAASHRLLAVLEHSEKPATGTADQMGATVFRTRTILFLPHLQMFGGIASDGWFGPRPSDTIIGCAAPGMVCLFRTQRSAALGLPFPRGMIAAFKGRTDTRGCAGIRDGRRDDLDVTPSRWPDPWTAAGPDETHRATGPSTGGSCAKSCWHRGRPTRLRSRQRAEWSW